MVSRSYRQIIVSFLAGNDGGFSQTITCQHTTSGQDRFQDASFRNYRLGFREQDELATCISDNLEPDTEYKIRLVSDNEYPIGSPAVSDVIEVKTRGVYFRAKRAVSTVRSQCLTYMYI